MTTMTDYQNFIALSRYARWKDNEQRRETWGETVDRYMENVVFPHAGDAFDSLRNANLLTRPCSSCYVGLESAFP